MSARKKAVPQYAPATCTFDQLVTIRRDNLSVGDFWIMTDTTTVWLHEQAVGADSSQKFSVPRSVFNKLIRWYLKPQKRIRK